jgi:hypothetical protein
MTTVSFDGFAMVEIKGGRRLAGYCQEIAALGTAFLRLTIFGPKPLPPMEDIPIVILHFSGDAIYSLEPMTEENARAVNALNAAWVVDQRKVNES